MKPFVLAAVWAGICLTLWGTVETVFLRDQGWDPSGVVMGRGGRDADPGTKAAGYLIQKYAPASSRVLALHRNLEPSNLFYYFRRSETGFYDLTEESSRDVFLAHRDSADLVVCDAGQVHLLRGDPDLALRSVISSEGVPRLWIFARENVPLPAVNADVSAYNKAFDEAFSWKPSLF